ncbi:conserved hypothetical protein [Xenorhabdus bovienii str. Intermedium]|uniref:Uncharacterized protein n=1 Tax=Xenorhabdus bovienii str. Intermedium TaxID=1379677 RepID=A0A077QI41_XENBV|nr:conserved hypothetical protein [Xenorhabdus bovienii str. Intermedium]
MFPQNSYYSILDALSEKAKGWQGSTFGCLILVINFTIKIKNSHYVTWKTSFLRAEHLYSH